MAAKNYYLASDMCPLLHCLQLGSQALAKEPFHPSPVAEAESSLLSQPQLLARKIDSELAPGQTIKPVLFAIH